MTITPDEIRAIRKELGLSQMEAGELLGGGSRAFTKYEAGTVKPSASVVKWLRLLEVNPSAIKALRGEVILSVEKYISPFKVTGKHIAALNEQILPELLRRLLSAEAQAYGLPKRGIHVASSITTPDGGEDGRIEWTGGPSKTDFLPSRLCQFQLKAGKVFRKIAEREVLTKSGEIKPMIHSILEKGGNYIILCAHSYVQKQINHIESSIREVLRDANIDIVDNQVDFRDADQIASWTNRYPSVATWVKQWTQPGTIGPFRSWSHWASRNEHDNSPWIEDERLHALRGLIQERATQKRHIIRILGPSGIGKSRLVLEALRPSDGNEGFGCSISDLVLYADKSEFASSVINEVIQVLAETGQRVVLVVNHCPPDTHDILVGMVLGNQSSLSLITIDDDISSDIKDQAIMDIREYESFVRVAEAHSSITEGIISHVCPELPFEDFRRLTLFSKGFPKIAHDIAQAWKRSRPVAHAVDKHFAETFILGRKPYNSDLLLKSAKLLAAFHLVNIDDPEDVHLGEIAAQGRDISASDLRSCFNDFVGRGVAKRRGQFVVLQPTPIALRLAETQWLEWNQKEWDEILGGNISFDLKVNAAKQLALLNTTKVAQKVIKRVCCPDGPFDSRADLFKPGHAEILLNLAQIDTSIVASQIEHSLQYFPDLQVIQGDVRRHLVWALEKIAFNPESFEQGAHLLLRLALNENETCSNNATGQFVALFPLILGNTAADGPTRLDLLDEVSQSNDPMQREIVVKALIAGLNTHHFSRLVGAETHGSLPSLVSWCPVTMDDALTYIKGCVTRLCKFATEDDVAAYVARSGLGQSLRSLVLDGFVDLVEEAVNHVSLKCDVWPEALEALENFFRYDASKLPLENTDRIRSLIDRLMQQDLDVRVRCIVTEMSWGYLCNEGGLDQELLYGRQVNAVHEFASELLGRPEILKRLLPKLSTLQKHSGRGRPMKDVFGYAIANLDDSPLDWLDPITEALREIPADNRDFDLLSGYLSGLSSDYADAVEAFKQRIAESVDFAPALPLICRRLGIVVSDIELVLLPISKGLLPPCQLEQWAMGGELAEIQAQAVAPLFDLLLDHSVEGYRAVLNLMCMYYFRNQDVLEDFRPQLRKSAENLMLWDHTQLWDHTYQPTIADHLVDLMTWFLNKGRDDPDACSTALVLAQVFVKLENHSAEHTLQPLIKLLLKQFPEIVWPIFGQAITSDHLCAWRLENLLGNRLSCLEDRHRAAILSLPEETLFAWCRANPDSAPVFAAVVLPVLSNYNYQEKQEPSLHPWMNRLFNEFGDRGDVLNAVESNIRSYVVWGPETRYFALHKVPLVSLRDNHQSWRVRRWARITLKRIDSLLDFIGNEEDKLYAQRDSLQI